MMVPNDIDELKNFTQRYSDITEPGEGWSSGKQAIYQLLALNVTLALSVISGVLTGNEGVFDLKL